MNEGQSNLEVSVRYKDVQVRFSGEPDDVIRSLFGFLNNVLPSYEFISGLMLSVDLEKLLKGLEGLIAFAPEGPVIIAPRDRLGGERNSIILNLIKTHVGYKTGRLEKDSMSTAEILTLTGGKTGTVGARLSELASLGWIERIGRGEYRMTTLGVKSFMEDILPKMRVEGVSER